MDKYKWHDLRKNPKDLPEYYKQVEMVYWDKETHKINNEYRCITCYGVHSPMGYIKEPMEMWRYPFQYFTYTYEVIAWRELEDLEELRIKEEEETDYTWHDLREDKADLPKVGKFIAITDGIHTFFGEVVERYAGLAIEMANYHNGGYNSYDLIEDYIDNGNFIAWKYFDNKEVNALKVR